MGSAMPPKGRYEFEVVGIEKGVSTGEKKTPYIEVTMISSEHEFSDQIYVTEKTLSRLCLFAKRICGMPDTFELPDGDKEASNVVARFIMENALGKCGIVTVEENEEKFMPSSGPDAGRMVSKMRRRVAFNGYQKMEIKNNQQKEDDLPF